MVYRHIEQTQARLDQPPPLIIHFFIDMRCLRIDFTARVLRFTFLDKHFRFRCLTRSFVKVPFVGILYII